jgi:hypothetical protein
MGYFLYLVFVSAVLASFQDVEFTLFVPRELEFRATVWRRTFSDSENTGSVPPFSNTTST